MPRCRFPHAPLRQATRAGLTLMLLAAIGSPAMAAPTAAERFARLDDPSFEIRESAMADLLADDQLDPPQLAGWIDQAHTLEQQHRLLTLARHHALRQQRQQQFPDEGPGSMGVIQVIRDLDDWPAPPAPPTDTADTAEPDARADDAPPRPPAGGAWACALITEVLPGFPAAGRLRPGDRIVALDNQPIPGPANATVFERRMRQYAAGEQLSLTVLRDDRLQIVTIPLANGLALAAMYRGSNHQLHQTFQDSWRDTRGRLFAPLLTEVSANPAPTRATPRTIFDALR